MIPKTSPALIAACLLAALFVSPASPAAGPGSCQEAHKGLSTWLKELAAQPAPPLPAQPEVDWVKLPDRPPWPEGLKGPLLELRQRRAVLNGDIMPKGLNERTKRLEALGNRYKTLNQLRSRAGKDSSQTPVLLLAIDAREPWSQVVPLLQAVSQAGFERIGLVHQRQTGVSLPPPGPSSIDGIIAEIKGSENSKKRQKRLARAMRQVLNPCPQLVNVFSSLAWVDAQERPTTLSEQVPEALSHCACKVDIPALKKLIWHLQYNPPLSVHISPLAGPDQKETLALRIDAAQPWQQVLPGLLKALKSEGERPLLFEIASVKK